MLWSEYFPITVKGAQHLHFFADLNPAAQGSSLTEGKRGKRSKKSNGETNGTEDGHPSDNDSSDQVVEAPDKLAEDDVSCTR